MDQDAGTPFIVVDAGYEAVCEASRVPFASPSSAADS